MTIDERKNMTIQGAVLVAIWFVLMGVLLMGCSERLNTVAPTPIVAAATSSTATMPAPTPTADVPNPPTAPTPLVENCRELDPKKWIGFGWRTSLTDVTLTNSSTCDRLVTFRAFAIGSGNSQSPSGDAVVVLVPAGAGVGQTRPYILRVHYYGTGEPPCGAVIQIDGRAGNQPTMTHDRADFVPGVLFTVPRCVPPPPPPPPPVCVDPNWGPWSDVVSIQTVPVCKKQRRSRTLCNGTVQVEERTVCS